MKKILQVSILVLLAITYIIVGLSYSAIHTAPSCGQTDVQQTLINASRGDTVRIPAGSCSWPGQVTYNKALIIEGAGSTDTGTPCTTGTCIKNTQAKCSASVCTNYSCSTYALRYTAPDLAGATADLAYMNRVTNIRWDLNYSGLGVSLRNVVTTFPLKKVMIDNNVFVNCWDCDVATILSPSPAIEIVGRIFGVIHSNKYYGYPIQAVSGATSSSGLNAGVVHFNYSDFNVIPGTDNAMYLEDNYLYSDGPRTYTGAEPFLIEQANGQTVVVRYNDFISNRTNSPHAKPWSPHHPAGGVNVGGKGGEFYGNYIKNNAGTVSWIWGTPRSGQGLMFYNRVYAHSGSLQWTMYNPTSYPPTTTTTACGPDVYAPWIEAYYCDKAGQPQHLWQSYQWVNKYGNTGVGSYTDTTVSDGGRLTANKHYYNYTSSFNGTAGVGCGTAATMNAIGTCTDGVTFWVPNAKLDPTAASCNDITNWVGRNNALALSVNGDTGRLYKCTSNEWVEYYKPLAYPHPLRSESVDSSAGSLSETSPTGQQTCVGEDEPVDISLTAQDTVGITGVKCCLDDAGVTCDEDTDYDDMSVTMSLLSGTAIEGVWGITVTNDCSTAVAYNCKGTDLAGNITPNIVISYDMDSSTDITNPTLSSQVLGTDGRTVILNLSEPIKDSGTYADSQWTLTVGGSQVSMACSSGWDTAVLTCQTASCVADDAVVTLDWDQPVTDDSITDQSGNPLVDFDPVKSVTNNSTQTCGATTSLFDQTDTPTYTTWPWDPGTVGVKFQSSATGSITHICFYKDVDQDGETHVGGIWNASGTLLGSKAFADETESGWQCQELDTPVGIVADTDYTVGVFMPSIQAHTSYYFASPYSSGDFSVGIGGGRVAWASSLAYPTNASGYNRNYWVDFTFSPAGAEGPWNVTVSKTGEGCTITSQPTEPVVDKATPEVVITVRNGWAVSVMGDCPSGSGMLSGNTYTWTTGSITEDCEVAVTCGEIQLAPWVTP